MFGAITLGAQYDCSSQSVPAIDPFLETCYLVQKNAHTFDICWSPPGVPVACTLQNHITYDILALYRLGANSSRLQQVYDYHLKSELLNPAVPSKGAVTDANWQASVGANFMNPTDKYSDFVDFFRSKIQNFDDLQPALDAYLPALVEGVFGRIYHGLLYLGWGGADVLQGSSGDLDIVAQGLAWMATASEPPQTLGAGSVSDPTAALAALHNDTRFPVYQGDPQNLYFVFFADLMANHSALLQEYDLSVSNDVTVEQAKTIIRHVQKAAFVYFASGANYSSFVAHHFISSSFAVEQLLPHISTGKVRATLLRRHWQGLVINFAISSRPDIFDAKVPDLVPTWDALIARAFVQQDVHVHKFVYLARDASSNPVFNGMEKLLQHSADLALQLFESGATWHF